MTSWILPEKGKPPSVTATRRVEKVFSFRNQMQAKRKDALLGAFSVLALPIFPGRLQPSIVGRSELNFRVRDGNGWTLALISTNYSVESLHLQNRTTKK